MHVKQYTCATKPAKMIPRNYSTGTILARTT